MSSGFRFSNGSDPEPWRCRSTDGKKWRCAKDVAPDQKYCERHAHKTKPRSRKPVENKNNNNNNNPIMISPANQQNRCSNDWLIKNGATATATPVSQMNNQFHFQPGKKDQICKEDFTGNHEHKRSYTDTCVSASEAAAGARRKDFIDAWSRTGGGDRSLTLSMQSGGNGFDHESFKMAVMRGGDVFEPNHEWLNHGSWAGSAPAG